MLAHGTAFIPPQHRQHPTICFGVSTALGSCCLPTSARVKLLMGPYPPKTVDQLKRLYPDAAMYLDDPDQRKALGLETGDRWPVILVGYVLHSLRREAVEINGPDAQPYCPQEGDEFFNA